LLLPNYTQASLFVTCPHLLQSEEQEEIKLSMCMSQVKVFSHCSCNKI
jgi:hypothetical protein